MKLGARIVKTGAAVALALYVCRWLGFTDGAAFAAAAAVLMIQPSLFRSWKNLMEQLQANLIGVTLAVAGVLLLGHHPIVVGLVVMFVIILNLRFGFEKSIPLSIFAVIAVTEGADSEAFLPFARDRFLLILIGMGSAMLFNALFIPPKYEGQLLTQMKETRDRTSLLLRSMVFQEIRMYPAEKKKLLEEVHRTEELFQRFEEEQSYRKKYRKRNGRALARKRVLFKRMIEVLHTELDTLRTLESNRVAFAQIPLPVRERVQGHIAELMAFHQTILGKYEGMIKTHDRYERAAKVSAGHEQLIRELVALYDPQTEEDFWIHLFPVVAELSELARQLEKLDQLIEVYVTYHKES